MKNVVVRFCTAVAASMFAFAIGTLHAQEEERQAPVNFSYSYATFDGNEGTSMVEFSYSFSENGLSYVNGVGQLYIELQFFDTAKTLLESFMWGVSHPLPEDGELTGRTITGLKRFELQPRSYIVALRLIDGANTERSDSTGFVMNVRAFPDDQLGLSDIELIREMAPSDPNAAPNPSQRNGYVLVRNVDALVTAPDYRLNSYLEIYNTGRIPASRYTLSYLIADSAGRGLYRRDTLLQRGDEPDVFDVNSVVVNGLATGWYIVAARVFNGPRSSASDSVEVLRSFFVYNRTNDSIVAAAREMIADSTGSIGLIDPFYAGLKEEELNTEYRKASLIMSPHQQSVWVQLNGADAKARFLTRFWMALDDDPATPENPVRDDYFERANFAKKVYKSPLYPNGWDSDRGRVLLQYGKPDQIDRHPNDYNRKPYERWVYTSLRYEFVFVDRSQTDNYQLVHSTAPNEISFPQWEGETAAIHKQMYQGEFDDAGTSPFRQ